MLRTVVLLRHGTFEAVECREEDIFGQARLRHAGICGVFDDRDSADNFIAAQSQLLAASIASAHAWRIGNRREG